MCRSTHWNIHRPHQSSWDEFATIFLLLLSFFSTHSRLKASVTRHSCGYCNNRILRTAYYRHGACVMCLYMSLGRIHEFSCHCGTNKTEQNETRQNSSKKDKHPPCSHPGDDACKRRITAKRQKGYSAQGGEGCQEVDASVFPEFSLYLESFCFTDWGENLEKKKQQSTIGKSWDSRLFEHYSQILKTDSSIGCKSRRAPSTDRG